MTDYATIADARYAAARARGTAFMAEDNATRPTAPQVSHIVTIADMSTPRRPQWEARCSCGARSGYQPNAGLCHGWEASHRDAACPNCEALCR